MPSARLFCMFEICPWHRLWLRLDWGLFLVLRKFPGCRFSEGGCALLGEAGVRVDPLQAEERVWRRAEQPGPSEPAWVPALRGGDLHGLPMCISSSGHLFSEVAGLGVLGSTGDHLTPKERMSPLHGRQRPVWRSFLGAYLSRFPRSGVCKSRAGVGKPNTAQNLPPGLTVPGSKGTDTQIWVSVLCSNFPLVHGAYWLTETVRNPRAAAGPRSCHAQLRAYVSLERSPRLPCLSL